MEIIGLGAALGLLIAAACVMCYRKGVRDGAGMKKGESPSQSFGLTAPAPGSPKSGAFWGGKQGGLKLQKGFGSGKAGMSEDEAAMMMRRYEAILSYDPYNQKAAMSGGEGA